MWTYVDLIKSEWLKEEYMDVKKINSTKYVLQ